MALPRIVLCLALLLSGVGLAQTPESEPASAPTEALPPPPLVTAPEQAETPPPEGELIPREYEPAESPGSEFSASRAILEVLGGGAVGAGMAVVGGIFGGLAFSGACAGEGCLGVIVISGIVGATFGVPLGVYGAGRLLDGQGSYWASFLGTVAGASVGTMVALAGQGEAAQVVGLTFGPLLGAILGYEFSHASKRSAPEPLPRQSGTGFEFHPAIGVTPGGGLFGSLSGRF